MAHSQVARTARRRGAESCGPQGAPVVSQAGSASGPALPNQVNSKSGGFQSGSRPTAIRAYLMPTAAPETLSVLVVQLLHRLLHGCAIS